ncbi:MAG TPA: TlpA disulfide reductase family protein [Sphingomicrobium sp.]
MTARFLASAILLLLSACGQKPPEGGAAAATDSAPVDPESGQGRALEAGRALIGTVPPSAVLHSVDGSAIDLAKAYGKVPVYLKFWATWCVPCRQQMPGFEAEFERYRGKILTVAVNTGFNDTPDAVRKYRQEHGLKMPIALDDGSLGEALRLRVTPQHVVIGRDGRILYVGHLDDQRLADALQQAVEQRPAQAAGSAMTPDASLDPLTKAAGFPIQGQYSRPRMLVFFSPWCERYFEKSRPAYSEACRRVREEVNRLASSGDAQWVGIAFGALVVGQGSSGLQERTECLPSAALPRWKRGRFPRLWRARCADRHHSGPQRTGRPPPGSEGRGLEQRAARGH